MRSKSTIYIAIAFALILVVSVGYALFSENIKISGTAKAEGSFDIVGSCETQITNSTLLSLAQSWWQEEYNETMPARNGVTSSSCSFNNATNTLSYQAALNYPGAKEYYTIKFTNNGTIDAYYRSTEFKKIIICEDNTTRTPVTINEGSDKCTKFTSSSAYNSNIGEYTSVIDMEHQFYAFESPSGKIITASSPQSDLSELMDEDENFVLKPGYSMYLIGVASIPDNIDNDAGILNLAERTEVEYQFSQKQ